MAPLKLLTLLSSNAATLLQRRGLLIKKQVHFSLSGSETEIHLMPSGKCQRGSRDVLGT